MATHAYRTRTSVVQAPLLRAGRGRLLYRTARQKAEAALSPYEGMHSSARYSEVCPAVAQTPAAHHHEAPKTLLSGEKKSEFHDGIVKPRLAFHGGAPISCGHMSTRDLPHGAAGLPKSGDTLLGLEVCSAWTNR